KRERERETERAHDTVSLDAVATSFQPSHYGGGAIRLPRPETSSIQLDRHTHTHKHTQHTPTHTHRHTHAPTPHKNPYPYIHMCRPTYTHTLKSVHVMELFSPPLH